MTPTLPLRLRRIPLCDMIQTMISSQPRSRAHPRAQLEIVRPTLDHVIEPVLSEVNETPEILRTKNHRPGRKAFAMLAYRECGLTMLMIAEYRGNLRSGESQK